LRGNKRQKCNWNETALLVLILICIYRKKKRSNYICEKRKEGREKEIKGRVWRKECGEKDHILQSKMTLSDKISTKTSQSAGKSGPHYDEH